VFGGTDCAPSQESANHSWELLSLDEEIVGLAEKMDSKMGVLCLI